MCLDLGRTNKLSLLCHSTGISETQFSSCLLEFLPGYFRFIKITMFLISLYILSHLVHNLGGIKWN
jgi:hypothetical protein